MQRPSLLLALPFAALPVALAAQPVPVPFTLTLSNPANASLGDAQAEARILNDDPVQQPGQELVHGTVRTLDFSVPAVFRVTQSPFSSYEVVVDATSGGARPLSLQRLASDLTTVLGQGIAEGTGGSITLSLANPTPNEIVDEYVRLTAGGCAPCGTGDTYRIRFRETTLSSPRFNNSGTQRTVLLVHNRGRQMAIGHAHFWSTSGALLHSEFFAVFPVGVLKLETADLPALSGQSGSLTITHFGHYGDLAGKTAAVDPATGFTFDHLLTGRPR